MNMCYFRGQLERLPYPYPTHILLYLTIASVGSDTVCSVEGYSRRNRTPQYYLLTNSNTRHATRQASYKAHTVHKQAFTVYQRPKQLDALYKWRVATSSELGSESVKGHIHKPFGLRRVLHLDARVLCVFEHHRRFVPWVRC